MFRKKADPDIVKHLHANILSEICSIPTHAVNDSYTANAKLNETHDSLTNACLEAIKNLLAMDSDAVNLADEFGSTLLHIAAQRGNSTITSFLLRHRAYPLVVNSNGYTALHLAILMRHYDCIKTLLLSPHTSKCNLDEYLQFALDKDADWYLFTIINSYSRKAKNHEELKQLFLDHKYRAFPQKFHSLVKLTEFIQALETETASETYPTIIDRFIIENKDCLNQEIIDPHLKMDGK